MISGARIARVRKLVAKCRDYAESQHPAEIELIRAVPALCDEIESLRSSPTGDVQAGLEARFAGIDEEMEELRDRVLRLEER